MFKEIEGFTQKYITNEIVVERDSLSRSKFKKFKKQLGDLIHKDYPGFSYEVWSCKTKIDRYFFNFHELKEIPVNKINDRVIFLMNFIKFLLII